MTTVVRLGLKVLYRPPLTGPDRKRVAAQLRKKYDKGSSVRSIAESEDMSYGTTHKLLREAGTVMRDRRGRPPGEPSATSS